MTPRMGKIYQDLYGKTLTKDYAAKKYNVSTKTIENTIMKYSKDEPNDVIYDTKISAYRFNSLLPRYIPYNILHSLFQESIANKIIRHDFLIAKKAFESSLDGNISMIETSSLSSLAQKFIQCTIAINQGCVLKIEYQGHKKDIEDKYVTPHKLISSGFNYYLYTRYDKRNKKDIGETRSLSLSGIHSITPLEYVKGADFALSGRGNAFGIINKEKFIMLKITSTAASFFKREGLFLEENFDLVSEEPDNSIVVKMYYNNIDEIVLLVQKWMPLIKIQDTISLSEEVYNKISENYKLLIPSDY